MKIDYTTKIDSYFTINRINIALIMIY